MGRLTMSEPARVAIRRTYEDVITFQGLLLDLLNEMVRDKCPLLGKERHKFNDWVSRAFIGQGTAVKADGEFRRIVCEEFPAGVVIENAEDALRFMPYLTTKVFCDDEGNEYDISELWKEARRLALRVFPRAIKAAMTMSPEQWYRGSGVPPDKG